MSVAVVIPCRNAASFVEVSVASVYGQSVKASEVVCVDDGSNDDTPAVLSACQRRYPGLVVIDQPPRGACAARNAGLIRTTAEWVQFLDADDVLLPRKLESQLTMAAHSPEAAVIIGSYLEVDRERKLIREMIERPDPDIAIALMVSRAGRTSSLLWRRRTVVEAGGWSESLGSSQEYELMFRLLLRGHRLLFDERPLTQVRRIGSGGITSTNVADNARRFLELRCEMFERLSVEGYPYQAELAQALFAAIRLAYSYDRRVALAALRRYLSPSFVPTMSRLYGLAFRVSGIRGAEIVSKAVAVLFAPAAARR